MRFRFDGLEFGGPFGPLLVTSFEPGAADIRNGDTDRSQRDGAIAGRDFLGKRTWGISVETMADDITGGLALERQLASRWLNEKFRLNPLATFPLAYELGGRWRRVYGRPDRYSGINGDLLSMNGIGKLECDYRILDPLFYDADESATILTIVPASTGGLKAPLIGPLSTVRSSAPRAGLVSNLGDQPTPLTVVFRGPVTDPWVRAAAGWEIALKGTLTYDQTVTVDARAGTVLRGSTPVAGMLTRKSRLSTARLPVGSSELTFGGTDPTGTARVELRWRNAFSSI